MVFLSIAVEGLRLADLTHFGLTPSHALVVRECKLDQAASGGLAEQSRDRPVVWVVGG